MEKRPAQNGPTLSQTPRKDGPPKIVSALKGCATRENLVVALVDATNRIHGDVAGKIANIEDGAGGTAFFGVLVVFSTRWPSPS